jgi:hypothetical protein
MVLGSNKSNKIMQTELKEENKAKPRLSGVPLGAPLPGCL